MKAAVFTLGCKVNQYESRAIITSLETLGFDAVEGLKEADLYVINTCSVTAEADKKSRQAVARVLKINPEAKIIITGCSSENNAADYLSKYGVVTVFGTRNKSKNVAKAAQLLSLGTEKNIKPDKIVENKKTAFDLTEIYDDDLPAPHSRNTRAYVKIQDGCNNFCSYCIVPYLRGRSRSRPVESIINEIGLLSEKTKEIVLTGIDISSYGSDNGGGLAGLVRAIEREILKPSGGVKKVLRLRLGSLECGVITEDLLLAMNGAGFCDHFHVSLQSGSAGVLRRMNRHYSPREFLDKTELIRKIFPYAGVTTDIIAGFPGETAAEHEETKKFLSDCGFSDLHVFSYSPRKGTKAYVLPQLEKKIREERAGEIGEIKNNLKTEFIQKNIGRQAGVYAEKREDGFVTGFTTNYIKVYTKLKSGELKNVRLTQVFKDGATGE